MKYARALIFVTCVVALGALFGCSGTADPAPTVEPQLEETKRIHAALSTQWQNFDTTMSSTLQAVDDLPTMTVPAKKIDVDLLRKALAECFEAPVDASSAAAKGGAVASGEAVTAPVASAPECDTESTKALEDLTKNYDPEIAEFINKKLGSIAMMRTNIKERLLTMSTDIAEQFAQAKLKIDEIRVAADTAKTTADADPDMSDGDKASFQEKYDELQTELTKLDELLESMQGDAMNLPDKVRVILEKATYALSTFGQ
jgi:hypothetical protein